MRFKWPFLFSVALAIGCSGGVDEEAVTPIRLACTPAKVGRAEDVLALVGTVRPPPDRDAPVAARVPGLITEVRVREGDSVRAGDVLVTLDGRSLGDGATAAEAAVALAEATAEQTDVRAKRKRALVAQGIVAKGDALDAEAEAKRAQADLVATRATADAARADRDRTRVTSPIDGVVVRLSAQVGAVVDAGAFLVEVADARQLEVQVSATVADLMQLTKGQPVRIKIDGRVEPLVGEVRAVALAVDPATGLGTVHIALADADGVPIGAMVNVSVVLAGRDEAVMIPATALRRGEHGQAEVVVCDGEAARVTAITLGVLGDDAQQEVTAGVAPGVQVATFGGVGIDDGTPILQASP